MRKPFSDSGLFALYMHYLGSDAEWRRWYAAGMANVLPLNQIARFAAQLALEAACGCELSVEFCEFIEAATPEEQHECQREHGTNVTPHGHQGRCPVGPSV
jgi:hypothetical protein